MFNGQLYKKDTRTRVCEFPSFYVRNANRLSAKFLIKSSKSLRPKTPHFDQMSLFAMVSKHMSLNATPQQLLQEVDQLRRPFPMGLILKRKNEADESSKSLK